MDEAHWAPIAVVALGDPGRRDEGIPIRILGRVRTLIGEIGCSRTEVRQIAATAGAVDAADDLIVDQGNLAIDVSPQHGELVQWIEGGTETGRLDPYLQDRERVVLIDAVELGRKPGTVVHWHLSRGRGGLTFIEHYGRPHEMGLDHLAFWLEDDLPPSGLDLIAIQPDDTEAGVGLSDTMQARFSTISSQVTALVFRILVEEGW
ncbi:MAG: hydrogenase maturation protease [Candidatus Eisenbacteria bacterium]